MSSYRHGIEQNLPGNALTFFATFSRFEYALKRSRFLTHDHPGQRAEPNWDSFANSLHREFFNQLGNEVATKYLFEQPPKLMQVGQHGDLDWVEKSAPNCNQALFGAVRRVRNNLFHGEKTVLDDRDGKLINAALCVLDSVFAEASKTSQSHKKLKEFCREFRFDT